MCDQNISNEKLEKLRNPWSKTKELHHFALGKGLFASVKGNHLFLTKGHSDNTEGQVEVEPLLIGSYFWRVWFILRKKKLFKKGTFNKPSDPWMLCLSKLGPAGVTIIHSTDIFTQKEVL